MVYAYGRKTQQGPREWRELQAYDLMPGIRTPFPLCPSEVYTCPSFRSFPRLSLSLRPAAIPPLLQLHPSFPSICFAKVRLLSSSRCSHLSKREACDFFPPAACALRAKRKGNHPQRGPFPAKRTENATMKTRTCSLPALSLFCAWAFTASSGSRAAGAAAFPLEHLPVAAPPFLSLHEQTGTLAMAAAQAKSRLGKRAARPASGSSPANGDFQFPSPFSSPSTSSSSSSPSPQFSGMRQAVQGLWGKLRQELWPTRPKAKGSK
jgi:hypothetical protein